MGTMIAQFTPSRTSTITATLGTTVTVIVTMIGTINIATGASAKYTTATIVTATADETTGTPRVETKTKVSGGSERPPT